jgi:hypothetical protein
MRSPLLSDAMAQRELIGRRSENGMRRAIEAAGIHLICDADGIPKGISTERPDAAA